MAVAKAISKAPAPSASSRAIQAPPRRNSRARGDQSRLAELKLKLSDEDYMNGAILRIATVLSASLTLK
jgi:hypothetical protein